MSMVKNPEAIKLGIIGMTEGNGHPYSWSAIFNGYNRKMMTAECPFPGIPAYLNKEDPATMRITGAEVTHICCNLVLDAEHIAKCSLIPHVAKEPEELIGKVDAVIIATDIGGEHVRRARPFVEAGIPLFIDKPLCDSIEDLQQFRQWIDRDHKPIMSSSSMRYAREFQPYHQRTAALGQLRFIFQPMVKEWETYGIHALESIYPIVGPGFETIQNVGSKGRNIVHITHRTGIDIVIACVRDMQYDGTLRLSGTAGNLMLASTDTFYAFKSQLQDFIDYLRTGVKPFPFSETEELMKLVIGGILSRENNGKRIAINEL